MEGKENISAELRLISAFVADIGRSTPYGLPDGYFESLAGKVLGRIRDGEANLELTSDRADGQERPEFLGVPGSGPAYSVPEGYFERFAENLMSRIKASQKTEKKTNIDNGVAEWEQLPALETVPGQSAREELAGLSSLLSRVDKKMPFDIPEGYFDSLAGTALLAGLKDKPLYQVPEGYFAQLSDSILERVSPAVIQVADKKEAYSGKQPAGAKMISLSGRRNWWKYSAAAAVAGLILTGGWLWTHRSVGTAPGSIDISKTLPTLSDQDIENYLDTNNITNSVPLPDELANSTASLDITDNDIKSFLGDVSDGELKQYIDEHGALKDLATN